MAHSVNRQSREKGAAPGKSVQTLRLWRRTLQRLPELMEKAGTSFPPALLMRSLTHRSFSHEHPDAPNNERLEFLGDSVIQSIATVYLFRRFPELTEKEMSSLRRAAVCEEGLAQIALELSLDQFLLLGKGAVREGGRRRPSLLCDAFEALVGAAFVNGGWEGAEKLAGPPLRKTIDRNLKNLEGSNPYMDWKTSLSVLSRSMELGEPSFSTSLDEGGEGFIATCLLPSGEVLAVGRGRKKKTAQENAAELSCKALQKRSAQI